jgi:alkylation response protein AidB-like acyl-CoA dehydrogenase
MRDRARVLEEAGHNLLGPQALNCAAPGEGNMHLLERVGADEQKRRYRAPLASGEVRSCLTMAEPPPGAGADPSLLRTTARPAPGGWVTGGHKWFITGAAGTACAVCMAPTPDAGPNAATMFLVRARTPASAPAAGSTHSAPGSPTATTKSTSSTARYRSQQCSAR